MKTLKKIAILSVALIFAALLNGETVIAQKKNANQIVPYCRHIVTVVLAEDQMWCGHYVIELRDGSGKLVAPAVVLNPGQTTYALYEKLSPVFDPGPRTAFLRQVYLPGQLQCAKSLRAKPSTLAGPFEPLKTYRFTLFASFRGKEE